MQKPRMGSLVREKGLKGGLKEILLKGPLKYWLGMLLGTKDSRSCRVKSVDQPTGFMAITMITQSHWMLDGFALNTTQNTTNT